MIFSIVFTIKSAKTRRGSFFLDWGGERAARRVDGRAALGLRLAQHERGRHLRTGSQHSGAALQSRIWRNTNIK